MSMRYQAGFLTASYFPLKVPNAPTGATATMIDGTSVSVAFTAPTDVGGGAITSYTVVSSGGNIATGSSSPITVTGLTTGTAYTFVVYANNAFGNSPASASSNSVTPVVQGQQAYTTAGTYSWVAPTGVTSVSVVAVGAGGGARSGGGGGLGYKNNITVVPGNAYTVVVGAGSPSTNGGQSYFDSFTVVRGGGGGIGTSTGQGGLYTGDGGGNGGHGSINVYGDYGGGGGAGGYSGNGGYGSDFVSAAQAGAGGGGGGGKGWNDGGYVAGGGGGGVGILGQGANGAAGTGSSDATAGGRGGSGGNTATGRAGATYGGGAGTLVSGGAYQNVAGAGGAVRIIWPGTSRQFPSTNTGDV